MQALFAALQQRTHAEADQRITRHVDGGRAVEDTGQFTIGGVIDIEQHFCDHLFREHRVIAFFNLLLHETIQGAECGIVLVPEPGKIRLLVDAN